MRFRVRAPASARVEVSVETGSAPAVGHPMSRGDQGLFDALVPNLQPGARYRYRLDGDGPFPDPASRCQPDGVHGPSLVVDPGAFAWSDVAWRGAELAGAVLYEIHIGTFTPEGTFRAGIAGLPALVDLGITAVELMPVADFAGDRNWGYDGVALFAPARCYGTPDDFRAFVDAAHRLGLAVVLDVVYNHLGPDGAYLPRFNPYVFTSRHQSPWGDGINLDGDHSAGVREFFIENALYWLHEYRVDGLRLDATHALIDEGPTPFLAELTARVAASTGDRAVVVTAEDHRNLATMVSPRARGGWGLDAVWADDFHHQVRRALAGDADGYYEDFTGSMADLATTVRQGWFFCGQPSTYLGHARGTDPTGVPRERFVICLQNHDQVGNRAFGERLHHQIDLAAYRAASLLMLASPETPLLFMGQDWAASSPFLYFTDHNAELGRLVTEGRRQEFGRFAAFADPATRAAIPDPQAASTFEASRLVWDEIAREPHASIRRFYQALIAWRRTEPAFAGGPASVVEVAGVGDDALVMRRARAGRSVVVVARFRGAGRLDLGGHPLLAGVSDHAAEVVMSTEAAGFDADPRPPRLEWSTGGLVIDFERPGAIAVAVAR